MRIQSCTFTTKISISLPTWATNTPGSATLVTGVKSKTFEGTDERVIPMSAGLFQAVWQIAQTFYGVWVVVVPQRCLHINLLVSI